MLWLLKGIHRINFMISQDNSNNEQTVNSKPSGSEDVHAGCLFFLKVQQTEVLRHIGFYGPGRSHFECCWLVYVDQDKALKFLYGYAIFISCLCLGYSLYPGPFQFAMHIIAHGRGPGYEAMSRQAI